MKMKSREVRLPKLRMEASFEPSTLNAESRTVELRWYAGATVARFSIFDGPFQLTFAMEPKSVRMGRLNSGTAPLKAGHVSNSDLSGVLGVIEKAWLAEDGGHALVRFSSRPDVEPIFRDVQDGILRSVSMEAAIHNMEEVTKKGEREPHYLATDWEPQAVALVAVGADPNAHALSDAETFPCQIHSSASASAEAPRGARAPKENSMKVRKIDSDEIIEILEDEFDEALHSKELEPKRRAPVEDEKVVQHKVRDAIEADEKRKAAILTAAEHYGLDEMWARRHVQLGTPIQKVLELAAEERAKRAPKTENDIGFGIEYDSLHYRSEQMAAALAARSVGKQVPESAKKFANMGFTDTAYEILRATRRDQGVDPRSRSDVIHLALSTADFPNLLANAGNKVLLPAYQAATPTYRMLSVRQDVADFKSVSILNTGDFPAPVQVGEGGEIKLGYFAEQKNTVALGTYGRRLAFTRQMLINDDLGSFGRVMGAYGIRVADFENAAFFTLLSTVGPTLGDGGAMFNSTAVTTAGGHANYTSSGTAISDTSITVGYALMAAQTGIGSDNLGDGVKLNIQPKYLLAAPGKRNLAFQYTSANYTPAGATSINSWAGVLTPVLDANLTGNRWWLFADPALFPNFAYGSLVGSPGPRVATRPGFEVEGVEMRIAFDFYVGGIDWRGGYCNAGA